MSLLKQLAFTNYISVNRTLIKLFGLEEAVIIGQLCSEYEYWESQDKLIDGMFYCTVEKLEETTGLSEYKQRVALKNLQNSGIIQTDLKGIPATRYFYIVEDKLLNLLSASSLKIKELVPEKFQSSNNSNIKTEKRHSISKDIECQRPFEFSSKKSKKPSLYDNCVNLIDDFTNDCKLRELLIKAFKLFLDNSKESGTPFYTNNFKGKLTTLRNLADDHGYFDIESAIKIVQQTLDKGWNNFYQLNVTKKANNTHDRLGESGNLYVKHHKLTEEEKRNGEKF